MTHLIFTIALTAVLSTQDETVTSGSPLEEKPATRSYEPVRRSESPSITLPHAQPPQDFKAALRQHLKNQGEPLNPEEFEQMLGTLEDIRSAVGGPALWPRPAMLK